ncbi:MAG: hypothetical protein EOO89_00255 [Pedobacter sp.]|nr:MAG: hypothetical protein EOO89_00255 [Pedobacter sp.]
MKQYILSTFLLVLVASTSHAQSCNCEELSGELSSMTIDNDHCWELDGCVTIPNNVTVNIEDGTIIYPRAGSGIVIERGGKLNVNGTSTAPVIFTPKLIVNRTYGYWEGISYGGRAPNNESIGTITLSRTCPVVGGGNVSNDNSGSISYLQMHCSVYGLTLVSVGTGTTIDNVQVTHTVNDGFSFYGGTVNATHLASFNAKKNDFYVINGYVGKLQFLFSFRKDPNAYTATNASNGFFAVNDISGSTNTPLTRPVISNYTTLGPRYCNGSANANFRNGILVDNRAAPSFYNSVIANWADEGLFINGNPCIAQTDADILNYSYNSTYQNVVADYSNAGSWASFGCSFIDMDHWIVNDPTISCSEDGNQFDASISTLGYDNTSICGGSSNPDFSLDLGTTDLDAASFAPSDLSSGFTTVGYRGAFGSTDWTDTWTDWAPLATAYCESGLRKANDETAQLRLIPNPASKQTAAVFTLKEKGKVSISILGGINGKVLFSLDLDKLEAGEQKIPVDISMLHSGPYIFRVTTSAGLMQQHLMIQ